MPSTETHFDLTSNDGVPIEAHRWQGPTQRAVIQLAHGMGEHSLRYRHLAKALVEAGYVVYGNEHRGHGKGAAARDELGEFGPRVPFYGAAALAFLNFVGAYFLLPETLDAKHRRPFELGRANPFGALRQIRRYQGIGWVCVVMFLNWLAHGVYPAVWAFVTSYRYGWSEGQIGFSLAVYGIGAAISMGLVLPRLVPVLGEWKTALLGLVFSCLGLLGYAFAWQGWMVYAVIVLTVVENVADAPLRSIAASKVPPSAQGELQGALGSLTSITAIIGPVLFPYLFQYYTAPGAPVVFAGAPLIMGAILVTVGLVVLLTKVRRTEPKVVVQSQAGEAA